MYYVHYDNYVIPLAQKLRECQVFGVWCDEFLDYAQGNRMEWEMKGREIVQDASYLGVDETEIIGDLRSTIVGLVNLRQVA
jgi:hypothetical protein